MKAFRIIGMSLAGAYIYLTGACGGHAGDEAGAIAEDEFTRKLADAVCDNLRPCCARNGIAFNRELCRQALERNERSEAPAYLRNTFAYDAEAAGECVALARQAAKTCQEPNGLSASCERVYEGTTPPGEPCIQSNECAAAPSGIASCETVGMQRVCVVSNRATGGPIRGTAGDLCTETCTEFPSGGQGCKGMMADPNSAVARCYTNDGLYCQSGTCRPQVALGGPCDAPDACVAGAQCEGGVCAPLTELDGTSSTAAAGSNFPNAEMCGSAG